MIHKQNLEPRTFINVWYAVSSTDNSIKYQLLNTNFCHYQTPLQLYIFTQNKSLAVAAMATQCCTSHIFGSKWGYSIMHCFSAISMNFTINHNCQKLDSLGDIFVTDSIIIIIFIRTKDTIVLGKTNTVQLPDT